MSVQYDKQEAYFGLFGVMIGAVGLLVFEGLRSLEHDHSVVASMMMPLMRISTTIMRRPVSFTMVTQQPRQSLRLLTLTLQFNQSLI
ncbi:hypothetical protein JCM19233_4404 [Vibrio astriarenae]|nr:hypothetical protein JCM19233_4404 [Vibrio sp. C7]